MCGTKHVHIWVQCRRRRLEAAGPASAGAPILIDFVPFVPRQVMDKVGPAVVAINVRSDRGESAGSGVFFAPDGYFLSNAHVVGGAEQVTITLTDGRKMTADVIGTDPATDLAVCQVTPRTPNTMRAASRRPTRDPPHCMRRSGAPRAARARTPSVPPPDPHPATAAAAAAERAG